MRVLGASRRRFQEHAPGQFLNRQARTAAAHGLPPSILITRPAGGLDGPWVVRDYSQLVKYRAVLHVEDDPNDVFLFSHAVRKAQLNLTLLHVPDGQQAVNYLTGSGLYADREHFPLPDLAVVDLKLPLFDGFEVLTWLREQPEFKSLPVLVLSSSNYPNDMARARQLGADDYFVKTADFAEVIQYIQTHLRPGTAIDSATPLPPLLRSAPPFAA